MSSATGPDNRAGTDAGTRPDIQPDIRPDIRPDIQPDAAPAVGLWGVATILYVVAALSPLLPADRLAAMSPLDALLTSGNVALAAGLCLFGFDATRRQLAARAVSVRAQLVVAAGQLMGVAVVAVLVAAAALLAHRYDDTDLTTWEVTRRSVLRTLAPWDTHWISRDPFGVRPDLAGTWLLGVAAWSVLAVTALVLLGGHRRRLLAGSATLLAAAAAGWRAYAAIERDWFWTSVDVAARADAVLLGAAAAAVAGRPRLAPQTRAALFGATLLVLLGMVMATPFVSVTESLTWVLPAVAVVAALAAWSGGDSGRDPSLGGQLARPELARVAGCWLGAAVWASFVAQTGERHIGDQPILLTLLVAGGAVGVLAAGTERLRAVLVALVRVRAPR